MLCCMNFFFFKQKTAYEMRISDWSSDVCSSDLGLSCPLHRRWPDHSGYPECDMCGNPYSWRSEERRVGKSVSVRVDLGGRRIIKKKINRKIHCVYIIIKDQRNISYKNLRQLSHHNS